YGQISSPPLPDGQVFPIASLADGTSGSASVPRLGRDGAVDLGSVPGARGALAVSDRNWINDGSATNLHRGDSIWVGTPAELSANRGTVLQSLGRTVWDGEAWVSGTRGSGVGSMDEELPRSWWGDSDALVLA